MNKQELRLPKIVEKDARCELITKILNENQKKLWSKSKLLVTTIPFKDKFIKALQMEHRKGHIIRGYDLVERKLELEANGLSLVDEKTSAKRGQRVSRLLIISNDGSERYFRKIESLIKHHSPRVLPIVVEVDSVKLGELFFGHGKAAKVMLVEHKESVASALFALVD